MNISQAFERRLSSGQKCFIPFITAGDPDIEITEKIILGMAEEGADIIEIGVPFSDPAADGPIIMEANIRALENGVGINEVFEMLARVSKKCDVALVFLVYANIVYSNGTEYFFKRCQECGVSGAIIADVPIEEEHEFRPFADKYGVELVRLIAPTSTKRIPAICDGAKGFMYCVSSMGVTGVREKVDEHLAAMFAEINKYCKIPTAIGFGISKPEQVKVVKKYTDGVIVGSAIVSIIGEKGRDCVPYVKDYVKSMREALDE